MTDVLDLARRIIIEMTVVYAIEHKNRNKLVIFFLLTANFLITYLMSLGSNKVTASRKPVAKGREIYSSGLLLQVFGD